MAGHDPEKFDGMFLARVQRCEKGIDEELIDPMEELREPDLEDHLEIELDSGEYLRCKLKIDPESGDGKMGRCLQFNTDMLWAGISIEKRELNKKKDLDQLTVKQEEGPEIGSKGRKDNVSLKTVERQDICSNYNIILYYLANNSIISMRDNTNVHVQEKFNLSVYQSNINPMVCAPHPIFKLEIDEASIWKSYAFKNAVVIHKVYPFLRKFCIFWLKERKFSRKAIVPDIIPIKSSADGDVDKKQENGSFGVKQGAGATMELLSDDDRDLYSSEEEPNLEEGHQTSDLNIIPIRSSADGDVNKKQENGGRWCKAAAGKLARMMKNWSNPIAFLFLIIFPAYAATQNQGFSAVSNYKMLICEMCPEVPRLNCTQDEREVCVRNHNGKALVLACVMNFMLYEACPYFTNSTKNGVNYTAAVFQDVNSDCTNCSSYGLWDVQNKTQCQKLDGAPENCLTDKTRSADGNAIWIYFAVPGLILSVLIACIFITTLWILNTERGRQYIHFLPSCIRPQHLDTDPVENKYAVVNMQEWINKY